MGVWDYIYGVGETVKRNSPDLTTVNWLCSSSYGYSTSTVSSVKNNAGKLLGRYWPSEETRSMIGPFATSLAKHSAEEGFKFVTGGGVPYKIIKKSLSDVNKSEKINKDVNRTVDIKALTDRLETIEREISEYKRAVDQSQTETNATKAIEPSDSNPTAMIREFMEKESMGRQFLDALIVPGTSRNKYAIRPMQEV